VIHKQPGLERAPVKIRRLLGECLQQDPKLRLRDIGDAKRLLEKESGPGRPSPAESRPRAALLSTVAAGVLLAALTVLSFIHFREQPSVQPTLRYTIALPENAQFHSFAVSPDGRYIALAAAVNGKRQLWLRALDALQFQPMPGTDDAELPFWSPDSRYIGFGAQDKLKKIAANGGPAQSLCDVTSLTGASWNREDTIVFSSGGANATIWRVPGAGGAPVNVTKTSDSATFSTYPTFLPDGRHFLYTAVGGSAEKTGIHVGSLDGSEDRRVLADVSSAVFAPSALGARAGHLLFVRENSLMAQPFDARSLNTTGDGFPLAEGVGVSTTSPYAPISASQSGVLLSGLSAASGASQIVWRDRAGKLLGSVGAPGRLFSPSLSPDQKTMAYSRGIGRAAANVDIWLRNLIRGTELRFTSDSSFNISPYWSPRGDRIVFTRAAVPYLKTVDGSGPEEALVSTPNAKSVTQWSRDGRFIVYYEQDPKTQRDLWVLPIGDGAKAIGKPIPFLQTRFNELQGQLSPDSHWMAYTSDESGRPEVYARPFPAAEGVWRISTAGGFMPRWRADSKELFYMGADGKITSVMVTASVGARPSFEPGTPVPLFDAHGNFERPFIAYTYDVTADGQRFLVETTASASSSSAAPPLTVETNWQAGLKK
jgi:Tol biopolymer transport system component